MSFLGLAARNLLRNKVRTGLTVAGVAVAILAFLLIQTAIAAWEIGVTTAAKDRLVSRHKVTFTMSLPKRYIDEVRQIDGIKEASFANWFGGLNPNAEKEFFQTLAVEPETYLKVYDEYGLTPEQQAAWQADRQGAVIGDVLASKFGWKVGDEIQLRSQIYPGEWKFRIHAIYQPLRKSAYRDVFLFDWDYLNENTFPSTKDTIGWISARVNPGVSAAELSKTIDARFDVQDTQTLTQDEGAFNQSFMGMFSTVLNALNIVSLVILGIMMLILGNTVAMGVRERTREYGVLRAVGFLPNHVRVLVVAEAVVLGLFGGLAGLVLAAPLIGAVGGFLETNMSMFFPIFRLGAPISLLAVGIAVAVGLVSALLPARSASQLKVVDALRHIA